MTNLKCAQSLNHNYILNYDKQKHTKVQQDLGFVILRYKHILYELD